jgi:hypothetical protein
LSRRKFVKAGITASIVATVVGDSPAQKRTRNGEIKLPGYSPDMLAYYNKSTFAAYVNSDFRFHAGRFGVDMKLASVDDRSGNEVIVAPDECFALRFEAPRGTALTQQTFRIEHAALGTFSLFVVPMALTPDAPRYYEAIINRRSTPSHTFSG